MLVMMVVGAVGCGSSEVGVVGVGDGVGVGRGSSDVGIVSVGDVGYDDGGGCWLWQ
jgi:hypothetical protein